MVPVQANYFKNDADTALSEGDAAFAARVANAPVPSSRCCIDARSYTQYVSQKPYVLFMCDTMIIILWVVFCCGTPDGFCFPQSCACNSDLMNAASGRGVSNNAVRVGEFPALCTLHAGSALGA